MPGGTPRARSNQCPRAAQRSRALSEPSRRQGTPLQNVDLVLLGGDLFHDNKPSRNTIVRAMDIVSKHCLNDRPVAFQVLSDQRQNFVNG